MTIHGNTSGLRPSETQALQRLYRKRLPFDTLTTPELTKSLCEISMSTSRQVGLLVDRAGTIHHVIIGDASKIYLPDIGRLRAAQGRLRGLRLIHTHLNNEPLTRDDIVDLTRLRLDLVAAICLAPDGRPMWVYYGHNIPVEPDSEDPPYATYGPLPYSQLDVNPAAIIEGIEEEFTRVGRTRKVTAKDGRAILVHVCTKRDSSRAQSSLQELHELARTAGVEVSDSVIQVRDRVDPKFVLGRGKLDDVVIRAMQLDVEVLIFDRDLYPAQAGALAGMTDLKILDRSQLILDIFAQHAHSRDGKLQVELAQMKYLLPRLAGRDGGLSRLAGGIGGRGPGETKLEVGRRRARERIDRLQRELKKLAKQRKQQRSRRNRSGLPVIAIVGYTNAGKSTLLNTITGSDVVAEDKLFATLDTRARRFSWDRERTVVFTDTVGFIRDLPKDLFAAFRATFEEAREANLLLHVVDASDPEHEQHIATTEKLLVELGLERLPRLTVYNKVDRLTEGFAESIDKRPDAVTSCALSSSGVEDVVTALQTHFFSETPDAETPDAETPDAETPDSETD